MGKGTCMLSLADVCIWLTIVCSIAALFAPFWFSLTISGGSRAPTISKGLFMDCSDPYGKHGFEQSCTFKKIDIQNTPKWLTSVQGLWAGGTALMFLLGVVSFFLCCDSCRKASCTAIVFIGVLIAALAFSAAVILFGIYGDKEFGLKFNRNHIIFFDWGFYLAIASAGLSLMASALFALVICCVRKEK